MLVASVSKIVYASQRIVYRTSGWDGGNRPGWRHPCERTHNLIRAAPSLLVPRSSSLAPAPAKLPTLPEPHIDHRQKSWHRHKTRLLHTETSRGTTCACMAPQLRLFEHAKSYVAGTCCRMLFATDRGTLEEGGSVPTSPPKRSAITAFGTAGIRGGTATIVVVGVPISDPFPDVPVHVIKSETVGFKLPHGC